MPKTLYGVYTMYPTDCIVPNSLNYMPHSTDEPIVFFKDKWQAIQHLDKEAHRFAETPTSVTFGLNLDKQLTIQGVGVLYQVSCPDDIYSQMQLADKDSYEGTFDGMYIEAVHAYIRDALHGSCVYSVYEMYDEISMRWQDCRNLDMALRHSTPDMLRQLDFHNLNTLASLQHMYGTAGRINQNFYTTNPFDDKLMQLEKMLYEQHFGIGYMAHILDIEEVYHETFRASGSYDCNFAEATARAVHDVLLSLHAQAKLYNDTRAVDIFQQMLDATAQETQNHDAVPNAPTAETKEDIFDIFEDR